MSRDPGRDELPFIRGSSRRIGGEPHYKCAAFRFGKGLSREPLKDIFAAAPCWRCATEGPFQPPRVEPG
jgi:hypothetical protein